MTEINSIRGRREKAREMSAWETDENDNYAGEMEVVDPIFVLGLIPVLGILYALVMIASGYNLTPSPTGVPQQAIRSGHIGLASQVIWLLAFVIVLVV